MRAQIKNKSSKQRSPTKKQESPPKITSRSRIASKKSALENPSSPIASVKRTLRGNRALIVTQQDENINDENEVTKAQVFSSSSSTVTTTSSSSSSICEYRAVAVELQNDSSSNTQQISSTSIMSNSITTNNNNNNNTNITSEVEEQIITTVEDSQDEDEDDTEFNPYSFIKNLPPLPLEYRHRAHSLPKKTRNTPKVSLVLDLDETLVHSSITPVAKYDLIIPVLCNGCEYQVYVKKRPHFDYFMSQVSQWFEIIVFTASQRVYGEKLLNVLDAEKKWIKFRQYRESCVEIEGNYLKDLTILGRDLAHTIIIDNSIYAFAYQIENGIPIKSWFDDENDQELLLLLPELKALSQADDVRPKIREMFKLHEHVMNAN